MRNSRIYALVAIAAVNLIAALAIAPLSSGSSFTEIAFRDRNSCDDVDRSVKMPTSLIMGPCETNEAGNCVLRASPNGLEIKATFPGSE